MYFLKTKFLLGIFYFVISLVISNLNDIITKFLGVNIPSAQIVFLRFFFSLISLAPFIRLKSIKTELAGLHIIRGIILYIAIIFWSFGLNKYNVSSATIISFTIPFFILIFAKYLLKEQIGLTKSLATFLGFLGTFFILDFKNYQNLQSLSLDNFSLLFAALLFGLLDTINKKYIVRESIVNMLFYSSLVVTIFSFPLAAYSWKNLLFKEIILLFILGIGANLILFFILKAFNYAEASFLGPLRYLELIISSVMGSIVFNETPHSSTLIGAIVIIFSSSLLMYVDYKKSDHANKSSSDGSS